MTRRHFSLAVLTLLLAVGSAANPDLSADVLLKQADVAMYSAKRSKSGGLHTFTPDMAFTDPNEFELPTEASDGGT